MISKGGVNLEAEISGKNSENQKSKMTVAATIAQSAGVAYQVYRSNNNQLQENVKGVTLIVQFLSEEDLDNPSLKTAKALLTLVMKQELFNQITKKKYIYETITNHMCDLNK